VEEVEEGGPAGRIVALRPDGVGRLADEGLYAGSVRGDAFGGDSRAEEPCLDEVGQAQGIGQLSEGREPLGGPELG
jgi:hypothetical protein